MSHTQQVPADQAITVHGVRITHPQKLLWPADGISKLDLVRYYEQVGPLLLRYAGRRPVTLRPFPRGVDQPGFYLKDAPKGAPPWLETFSDVAQSTGEAVHFVVLDDLRTLLWMAQFNAVEVHAWLSRVDRPDRPDWAIVDLDPADETPWPRIAEAARLAHQALEAAGLRAFAKLSGQSGIHILVPLARVHTYADVRTFFERLARQLCDAAPDLLTTDYQTAQRGGRILIDYAQNAYGKNTVAPYSVRPRPGAPVSAPIAWSELDDGDLRANTWTLRSLPERLARVGDLLEPALQLHQRLPRR